jgi:hypothetical protein
MMATPGGDEITHRSLLASLVRHGTHRPHGRFQDSKTCLEEKTMPRGDKSSYTDKQKRMAEHIEEGYESRGVGEKESERRAWATVNEETHGGKKSGSGRGKKRDLAASRKGGRLGGQAAARRPAAARSASARKAARTRRAAH